MFKIKIAMRKKLTKTWFCKMKMKNLDIVNAQYLSPTFSSEFAIKFSADLRLFWTLRLRWLHGSQRSVLRFSTMFGVAIHELYIVGDMMIN